jgi:hypothetical protein
MKVENGERKDGRMKANQKINGVDVVVCGRREYQRRETWRGRGRRKKEDGERVREGDEGRREGGEKERSLRL